MSRKSVAARQPAGGRSEYPGEALRQHWERLHHSDREPFPDETLIERLSRSNPDFARSVTDAGGAERLAQALQAGWREFHAGRFDAASERGSALGPLGTILSNRAVAVHVLYGGSGAHALSLLQSGIEHGESAARVLSEHANAHYMLALVLGRYSQAISILKALAQGLAGRVHAHLKRTLELEPRHAEAHLALGLYHAEIVSKLGALAASLTYGATAAGALEHFRRAMRLAPESPIVHIEYANGLLLLDAKRHRAQAQELYQQAAALSPVDAMERLDVQRARRGLA